MLVITGASGLLGANLVLEAQDRDLAVVAVSHRTRIGAREVRNLQFDLADPDVPWSDLRDFAPEWIIHCAAATNVDWCEDHPAEARRLNAETTRQLARFARSCGAKLLYVSTDSVFDGTRGDYDETDGEAPVNTYSQTKLAGEIAIREELPEGWLIVRTNFYGWNMQSKESLAEWVLNRLESGEIVTGFTDVIFTPIGVTELSKAILDLTRQEASGLYHVAGSEAASKYDFAQRLAEVFGLDTRSVRPGSVRSSHLRAMRPLNTSLRTSKVARALGRPMPGVTAGLERFKELRRSGHVQRLKRLATTAGS